MQNKIHPQQIPISDTIFDDLQRRLKVKLKELTKDEFYLSIGYPVYLRNKKTCGIIVGTAWIIYNGLVLSLIGILIYMIQQQWIDWDELEKINDSQCPYGFIYILISIPILLIQGYDYDSESQNEKEIDILLEDLDYFKNIDNQNRKKRELFAFHKVIKLSIIKYLIYPLQMLVIFFSDGFYSAVNSFVFLTFIGQLQRGVMQNIEVSKLKGGQQDLLQIYKQFDIQRDIIYEDEDDKKIQLFSSVLQQLKDSSNELIFEKGNQHSFIFRRYLDLFFYVKIIITITYSALYAFSLYNFWNSENETDLGQTLGKRFIQIITFYIAQPDLDFKVIYELNNCKQYLLFLNKFEYKDKLVKYKEIQIDDNLILIGSLYAQKQCMKILSFILIVFTFQFQEIYDFIINLYSLEYILNLDKGIIDQIYHWFSRDRIRKLTQSSIFSYPQQLKYKTFDQYYCYYLQLKINEDDFREEVINNEDLSQIIMKELNQLYDQLFYEDGFQLIFIEPFKSMVMRWCVFLILVVCYSSLMLIDKIQKWYDLSDVYINGQCPWGVVYIAISIPIIYSQGIGSGENSLFQRYFLLRQHYVEINNNQQPKFQWNDKILQDLNQFKKIQNNFLLMVLITLIFFQQYYYEVILNILQLEFLSTLDDHLIGNYFRYRYRFTNLQKNWTELNKISKLKDQTLENIYKYVWGLNQDNQLVESKFREQTKYHKEEAYIRYLQGEYTKEQEVSQQDIQEGIEIIFGEIELINVDELPLPIYQLQEQISNKWADRSINLKLLMSIYHNINSRGIIIMKKVGFLFYITHINQSFLSNYRQNPTFNN